MDARKYKHKNIVVAGIGTDVGKTVTSAVLATWLQADYWKPIQTGDSDAEALLALTSGIKVHPHLYHFRTPVSPHHAAKLENRGIDKGKFVLPKTEKRLVLEMAGGVCVPLSEQHLSLDLFAMQAAGWVVVSKNYLGSINHTLLTIQMLLNRGIDVLGVVFNGHAYPEGEAAILRHAKMPCIGRLQPEPIINKETIIKYASLWKTQCNWL